jgi:hypothetical protein
MRIPLPVARADAPIGESLPAIDWRELGARARWLPDASLSLYGLPEFAALDAGARERLSQYEFINVMYCGLWLESIFLQRVSGLLLPGMPRAEHAHLLQELREETGHSLMFLRAIEAGGVAVPEGSWRAPRTAALLGRFAPARGAIFWLAMLIGEHVSDSFNRHLCDEARDVNPAVRQISLLHVADEARHIAYARAKLAAILADCGALQRGAWSIAARILLRQMTAVFYTPPARFYRLAGLAPRTDWRAAALRNPARQEFVAQRVAPTLQLLRDIGLNVGG